MEKMNSPHHPILSGPLEIFHQMLVFGLHNTMYRQLHLQASASTRSYRPTMFLRTLDCELDACTRRARRARFEVNEACFCDVLCCRGLLTVNGKADLCLLAYTRVSLIGINLIKRAATMRTMPIHCTDRRPRIFYSAVRLRKCRRAGTASA
eukprot:2143270-Rhodomonas_salina.1